MASAYGRNSRPESNDRRIAALAATQYGIFSRKQAIDRGISETMIHRRIASGRWDRIHPGVFRLAGASESWHQSVIALCFAWGPGALASHRCAGALWRLAGLVPGIIELIVPRTRQRALPGIVHRPRALSPVDLTIVDAIPLTTAARTLLDLAGVVSPDVVEEALDDALRRKLVSLSRLRWRLRETAHMGTPGAATMRSLIDARVGDTAVPQSVFETRLLRLLKGAGLPIPVLQHEISDRGRLIAVVDFAFPDVRLAVEAEGYRWHSGRRRFERDLARRNALTALGWRVVHVTWRDLDDPNALIRTLGAAGVRTR
jgi:hypothetical protein